MSGLPNTSYRDIAIKGNDLIVATYGRGLYVLDDISMLRQADAGKSRPKPRTCSSRATPYERVAT